MEKKKKPPAPVKKVQKQNDKKPVEITVEQIQQRKSDISKDITSHIGQYAILLERSGRHASSFFIQITGVNTGKYRCYDFEGTFRCTVTKYLDVISLMIGEQRLVYLDSI